MITIEIDEVVWEFLKQHARPLEDTSNSVLKRLLGIENASQVLKKKSPKDDVLSSQKQNIEMPLYSSYMRKELQELLNVIYLVVKEKITRVEATKIVAKEFGVNRTTIADKYIRGLGLSTDDFDYLLYQDNKKLREMLESKFPKNLGDINKVFN